MIDNYVRETHLNCREKHYYGLSTLQLLLMLLNQ